MILNILESKVECLNKSQYFSHEWPKYRNLKTHLEFAILSIERKCFEKLYKISKKMFMKSHLLSVFGKNKMNIESIEKSFLLLTSRFHENWKKLINWCTWRRNFQSGKNWATEWIKKTKKVQLKQIKPLLSLHCIKFH